MIYSISPTLGMIRFEKKYLINNEIISSKPKIQKTYNELSSNTNILSIENNIYNSDITFSWDKNMLIFKIKKDFVVENEKDILIEVDLNWKIISRNIDLEAKDRIDEYYYSEPIYVDNTKNIKYKITTKPYIELDNIEIIWLNTENYNYKLVIDNGENIANWAEDSWIISRKEWWANEEYRYEDSEIWKSIFKKQEEANSKPKESRQTEIDNIMSSALNSVTSSKTSPWEVWLKIKKETESLKTWLIANNQKYRADYAWIKLNSLKLSLIKKHLQLNYPELENPVETIKKDTNGRPLVWNIEKTKKVQKIVIHHTAWGYWANSDEWYIRWDYYYHTITLGRWDLWYNYIIWQNWQIYEWRAGWDYVIAGHAAYNNWSTVWISVLGNYENIDLNNNQVNWINRAIQILSMKYGIDISKKSISHKACLDNESCLIKDYETPNLVWHRDIWYTACPGKNIYNKMDNFRSAADYTKNFSYVENKNFSSNAGQSNNTIKSKWPNVKVKLSYPTNNIKIKSLNWKETFLSLLTYKNQKIKWNFEYSFEATWTNKLNLIVWTKKIALPGKIQINSDILEITSWSRVPAWDKEKRYNDNKFRWTLTLYNEDWKLVVVNELPLEDYLKWLWEVWNTDSTEKSKTIITSARTYALFYTDSKNRKFPGKYYDWSDDPNVFQKYLGYSLESRNTKVNPLVEQTNWMVIQQNWKTIKPWYFTQSNWTTTSYVDYCKKNMWWVGCEINFQAQYLKSVVDPAGNLWAKWHWVWISWAWAEKLAQEWKKYDEIIKYFLSWVEVKKIY